ncbi:protein of unknown function [Burkholderia multivorans]
MTVTARQTPRCASRRKRSAANDACDRATHPRPPSVTTTRNVRGTDAIAHAIVGIRPLREAGRRGGAGLPLHAVTTPRTVAPQI